jgi:hypothetical protein
MLELASLPAQAAERELAPEQSIGEQVAALAAVLGLAVGPEPNPTRDQGPRRRTARRGRPAGVIPAGFPRRGAWGSQGRAAPGL